VHDPEQDLRDDERVSSEEVTLRASRTTEEVEAGPRRSNVSR
jgi:hypothetical protein